MAACDGLDGVADGVISHQAGTDFGRPGTGVQQTVTYLGLNTLQPTTPMPPCLPSGGVPYRSGFWSQWAKHFVTQADLSAFESRGGKILMAHGTSDQLVSTRATQAYYARVQAAMGTARTAGFLRYFEIPTWPPASPAPHRRPRPTVQRAVG